MLEQIPRSGQDIFHDEVHNYPLHDYFPLFTSQGFDEIKSLFEHEKDTSE